jgi:uncharacterized membrane protein YeaQ/YmgE (transglycosylase-associated protein family)
VNLHLTIDDIPRILVLLILAAVAGWLSDFFAGGRVPLGFFGSVLFGLGGAVLAVEFVRPHLPFTLPTEPTFDHVPLVTAGIGAFILSLLWCILVSRFNRR